jgi:hypothetical protein
MILLSQRLKENMMSEAFQSVTGVPCGNTWETLSGGEKKRLCLDCDRYVHNLATVTAAELKQLKQKNLGWLCVVYQWPAWALLQKSACAILPVILMSQAAYAADPSLADEAEKPRSCSSYLYTPMIIPPNQACLDEKGETVTIQAWQKTVQNASQKKEKEVETGEP